MTKRIIATSLYIAIHVIIILQLFPVFGWGAITISFILSCAWGSVFIMMCVLFDVLILGNKYE